MTLKLAIALLLACPLADAKFCPGSPKQLCRMMCPPINCPQGTSAPACLHFLSFSNSIGQRVSREVSVAFAILTGRLFVWQASARCATVAAAPPRASPSRRMQAPSMTAKTTTALRMTQFAKWKDRAMGGGTTGAECAR